MRLPSKKQVLTDTKSASAMNLEFPASSTIPNRWLLLVNCPVFSILTSSYFSHLIGHHTPATVAFLSVLKITMFLLALRPSHSLCSMLKYAHIPPSPKSLLILQTSAPTSLPQGSLPIPLPHPDTVLHGTPNCSSTVPASTRIISLFV